MAGMAGAQKTAILSAIKQTEASGREIGFALGTAGKSHADHMMEVGRGATGAKMAAAIKKDHQGAKIHAMGRMVLRDGILWVTTKEPVDKIRKNLAATIGRTSLWTEIRKAGDGDDEAEDRSEDAALDAGSVAEKDPVSPSAAKDPQPSPDLDAGAQAAKPGGDALAAADDAAPPYAVEDPSPSPAPSAAAAEVKPGRDTTTAKADPAPPYTVEDPAPLPPYGAATEAEATPDPATAPAAEAGPEAETDAPGGAMAAEIAGQVTRIADHMLRLAPQIGMTETVPTTALSETLTGWLSSALEATPPEEREARLAQLTARLLLMLSYTGAMTQLLGGGKGAAEPAAPPPRPVAGPPPRPLRLADVPQEPMGAAELAELVYADLLATAAAQPFPYDLSKASPASLQRMIAGKWKDGMPSAAQPQQAEALRRFLEHLLQTEQARASALGLNQLIDPADAADALLGRARQRWQDMVATAQADFAAIQKAAADYLTSLNPEWTVEALNGSWNRASDALSFLTSVDVDAGVAAILASRGSARAQAIGTAIELVEQLLARLEGDAVLSQLNAAPFPGVGGLGDRLKASLGVIGHMLQNLREAELATADA